MRTRRSFSAILLLVAFSIAAGAAEVHLKDGSEPISGEVAGFGNGEFIVRLDNDELRQVRQSEIAFILFDGTLEEITGTPVKLGLRFHGSNTVGEELVPGLVESFIEGRGGRGLQWLRMGSDVEHRLVVRSDRGEGEFPRQVDVYARGSTSSFEALLAGEADIGMSSRPIKQEEWIELSSLGDLKSSNSEHVLAMDGLAVIVHPSNPVKSLTSLDIARLFACQGRHGSWSAVGGQDVPVKIYAPGDESGNWDTFQNLVLAANRLDLCSDAERFESSSEMSDAVAADPAGIGIVGFPYIRQAKAVGIVECDLVYFPAEFAVKTEEYPLARRLFLYTPDTPGSPYADSFVQFALGPEGQERVADLEFVNLAITRDEQGSQQSRMTAAVLAMEDDDVLKRLVRMSQGATRLSVTFRFGIGSSELDTRAIRDVERLRSYLKKPENRVDEIMFLGFSDSDGFARTNLSISRDRARTVASALGIRGLDVTVDGFGEEAPVACNDNEKGKHRNRRVEVWVR